MAKTPQEQAMLWYARLQNPELPASERISFRAWLNASPENLDAFNATERLWQELRMPSQALGANGWHRRHRYGALHNWRVLGMAMVILLLTSLGALSQ